MFSLTSTKRLPATLIYIDGVSEVNISDGSLVLYADDIVLNRTICSSSDYLYLQNDVNALADCISASLLNLNPTKSKYMILEKVQTFALRMGTKNWTADYDSLLTTCNLPSLKKRRLFLKLSFLLSTSQ